MKAQRKDLAAFTIIIGVLTLILTVSALAEKAHGDHLPETKRPGDRRGSHCFRHPRRDSHPPVSRFQFHQSHEPLQNHE
jgi:hypothetical protein